MKETTIKRLSDLTVSMMEESSIKRAIKGYDGKVALVKVYTKWMAVPDINKLPEFVDFVWAFAAFHHPGRNKNEGIICNEIAKCVNGIPYSVRRMAEVAPLIKL